MGALCYRHRVVAVTAVTRAQRGESTRASPAAPQGPRWEPGEAALARLSLSSRAVCLVVQQDEQARPPGQRPTAAVHCYRLASLDANAEFGTQVSLGSHTWEK